MAGSRQGSWRADCMRQVRRALCLVGPRPKADGRTAAMIVNHFAGRRTARSFPLSLVLHKCQMNSREPSREQAASRGRSGSRLWSAERRRVSANDHHQAICVYSCFRQGRYDLVCSSREYTPNPRPVRPVCPTNTRRQHLELFGGSLWSVPLQRAGETFRNWHYQIFG